MSLFGFGKKKQLMKEREQSQIPAHLHPNRAMLRLTEELKKQGPGDIEGVLRMRVMCVKCHHEFAVADGVTMEDQNLSLRLNCPACGQLHFTVGYQT
jgi:DNA-directed RNA polymerase subunit RPC12/RpoP